jgi:site-specific DNA recombinase
MKLVGYTRVSTVDQADNTSLEDQRTKILSYGVAMGHEVVKCFEEVASGKQTGNRPEFQSAIGLLTSGDADGLIVAKLDRLGRNVRDILTFVDEVIAPLNKSLIILDLQIDTSTPPGRMVLTMMGAMAEMERAIIRERVERGRQAKADRGGYAFGAPPIGMKAVDGELVEDEREQETIALIQRHRKSGKSPQKIADFLNAQSIPTKRGGVWHHSTVRKVLGR